MASFKAKFQVLQELFAKNHRGPLALPPPAGRGLRVFPDENVLDDLLKSAHILDVFIHISELLGLQARGVSAKAL